MARPNVAQSAIQSARRSANSVTTQIKDTIRALFEKMGFQINEGVWSYQEEWLSETTVLLEGEMELEADSGLLLKVRFSGPIEFGEYSLEIGDMKVTGPTA